MRKSVLAGGSLAFALLVGSVFAADSLKSGPQVGEKVEAFEPLNVTGPLAPEEKCLV